MQIHQVLSMMSSVWQEHLQEHGYVQECQEHFHRHHSYRIRSIRIDHVNRSRYGVALSTRIIR